MIFKSKERAFLEIKQNGFLIGMLDGVAYETESTEIEINDVLFLYTDGLFCAGEASDFTGWDKVFSLSRHLIDVLEVNPKEFLEDIFYGFHMIHKANHTDFNDDVAMMLIKVKK